MGGIDYHELARLINTRKNATVFDPPQAPALPQQPNAPQAPPTFGQSPVGQKPKKKSMQPTFLASEDTPGAGQTGQKTLIGQ